MVKDLTKEKTRPHEPDRAFRMSFPILKYLALKTEPVTAYKLEGEKLDVMRDGKSRKAWIDKPTIYRALKLMEDNKQVELRDRKPCKGGRVRKKYVVTPRGVVALLWGRPDHIEISKQDAREWAKKHHDFFPKMFDLWSEFIQENVEDAAWSKLTEAGHSALAENIEGMFLGLVLDDLKSPTNPDHDVWLQAVGRNETIREALVGFTLNGLAETINDVNELFRLLPDHSSNTDLPRFNQALTDFWASMIRVDREEQTAIGGREGPRR